MKTLRKLFLFILILPFLIVSNPIVAQKKSKSKKKNKTELTPETPKKENGIKSIKEATKSHTKIDGLFTVFQDSASGSLKMLILKEQFDSEFIHFYYFENGVLETQSFRGRYLGSKIFKIKRYFDRIEFVEQNTGFYIDPNSALINSEGANISGAVLFTSKIVAIDSLKSKFLIEADDLFLSDNLGMLKPIPSDKPNPKAFKLGSLSKEKTKYLSIRNYPANTDLIIEYVFENKAPTNGGSNAVTDARNVGLKVQHSLIKVPDNDYEPRYEDPRVGYFTTEVNDLTSLGTTPYRDLVHRWNLVKKYPDKDLSEPVEPIVYWIENTTPRALRSTIKKAGEKWNIAFEKAGFKNAIVIKTQPNTAIWDAGDIRYNVLRWTSSPNLAFGGYGPSFVNPRTGQILGADIMLEYKVISNNLFYEKTFGKSSITEFNKNEYLDNIHFCSAGFYAQQNQLFGMVANEVLNSSEMENSKMLDEFIYYLILHEMGHTLGLSHNMKASQMHSIGEIQNETLTTKVGLTGSVMDYPSINIALNRDKQGLYWTTTPGPYDLWAIEFGYRPLKNQDELNKILEKSTNPELAFGNDADDMRSPGRGIDPRTNIYDMSGNAVQYATERIQLSQKVMAELLTKFRVEGENYHDLKIAFSIVTNQQLRAAAVIANYVGGIYIERSDYGQTGAKIPFTPVDAAKQKQAMQALSKYIFAPNAFEVSSELYNYLQIQRRGFNFSGKNEDPKINQGVLNIQKRVLDHLLHPVVQQRIVDTELYGNEYKLSAMMVELNKAIFLADYNTSVTSFRQNLQLEYVNRLIKIAKSSKEYCSQSKSMALYNLNLIEKNISVNSGDLQSRAHKRHLKYLIENALDN